MVYLKIVKFIKLEKSITTIVQQQVFIKMKPHEQCKKAGLSSLLK